MTNHKTIQLARREQVVAVVPEYCGGPGWTNQIINVHIVNTATNEYRCEFIQPEERTAEQNALFYAGSAMCNSLIASVRTERVK